jgi:hypothetical protein
MRDRRASIGMPRSACLDRDLSIGVCERNGAIRRQLGPADRIGPRAPVCVLPSSSLRESVRARIAVWPAPPSDTPDSAPTAARLPLLGSDGALIARHRPPVQKPRYDNSAALVVRMPQAGDQEYLLFRSGYLSELERITVLTLEREPIVDEASNEKSASPDRFEQPELVFR